MSGSIQYPRLITLGNKEVIVDSQDGETGHTDTFCHQGERLLIAQDRWNEQKNSYEFAFQNEVAPSYVIQHCLEYVDAKWSVLYPNEKQRFSLNAFIQQPPESPITNVVVLIYQQTIKIAGKGQYSIEGCEISISKARDSGGVGYVTSTIVPQMPYIKFPRNAWWNGNPTVTVQKEEGKFELKFMKRREQEDPPLEI